jgi:galactose mutarotase-like enzyme
MDYTLQNEELAVRLGSLGGQLTSIVRNGIEYLWQADPAYWKGQAPILFPICGSLRDDQATIGDGLVTKMPRHGLIRKKEFECVAHDESSVTFRIVSTDEMHEAYPYRFAVAIRYALDGARIDVRYTVENRDERPMPFQIGGHPAFRCPLLDGERYEDYEVRFEVPETCTIPKNLPDSGLIDMGSRRQLLDGTDVLPLSHELFRVDALTLDELRSRRVRMVSRTSGHGVELSFPDFPYLILWSTANDGPFLAMEPWAGLSTCSDEDDVFEHKRNVQTAAPGESKSYEFSIGVF